MREANSQATDDSTEVASEDKGITTSIEDTVCQEGALSKGSKKRRYPYSISLSTKKPRIISICPTVLLTQKQDRIFTGIPKTNCHNFR